MVSPLGAGALSGSSLPIQPAAAAAHAGVVCTFANSMDAVGDRDFLVEFLAACTICSVHLSQLAETFILWTTSEFAFIEFGDDVCTSSSLMPNKKNPDPLEIMRAKCGSMVGDLVSALTILKSLPLGYNRDLQETKGPAIRTANTLQSALVVLKSIIASTSVNKVKMLAAASDPLLLATDLVEYLVKRGMAFRQAHEAVSEIVGWCRMNQRSLSTLSLSELQQFEPSFDADPFQVIDPVRSVASRTSLGGTAPAKVSAALIKARESILPVG
jgi:argininosuccinate lyase